MSTSKYKLQMWPVQMIHHSLCIMTIEMIFHPTQFRTERIQAESIQCLLNIDRCIAIMTWSIEIEILFGGRAFKRYHFNLYHSDGIIKIPNLSHQLEKNQIVECKVNERYLGIYICIC